MPHNKDTVPLIWMCLETYSSKKGYTPACQIRNKKRAEPVTTLPWMEGCNVYYLSNSPFPITPSPDAVFSPCQSSFYSILRCPTERCTHIREAFLHRLIALSFSIPFWRHLAIKWFVILVLKVGGAKQRLFICFSKNNFQKQFLIILWLFFCYWFHNLSLSLPQKERLEDSSFVELAERNGKSLWQPKGPQTAINVERVQVML
jgi:hypothetical protein